MNRSTTASLSRPLPSRADTTVALEDGAALRPALVLGVASLLVLGLAYAVATTGVAGPEPHQGKPVGTVWLGLAVGAQLAEAAAVVAGERGEPQEDGTVTVARLLRLDGDREAIRAASTRAALALVAELLGR